MNSNVDVQAVRLLADDDFQMLAACLSGVNMFKAVGMERQEIRHSAFLAWLMDPSAPHGLGDRFLRLFLAKLLQDNPTEGFSDLAIDDLSDVHVIRERESNIDILVRTSDRRMVMCIENKVDSGLHDRQLEKYWRYIESTYGVYQHRIYIFLTPGGDEVPEEECKDGDWCSLSYNTIVQVLRLIRPCASERTAMIIDDYINLLKEENIVNDDELNYLASTLYKKYRDVFDLVNNRCNGSSAVANTLRDIYLEVLNELKREQKISDCSPKGTTSVYLSFQTRRMDDFLHDEESPEFGSWGERSGPYHYWVYPPLVKPSIKLEVGPLNQSDSVIERMRKLQDAGNSRKGRISSDNKYRTIEKIQTGIDESSTNDDEDIDVDMIREELRAKIEMMLAFEEKTLDTIEIGSRYKGDL